MGYLFTTQVGTWVIRNSPHYHNKWELVWCTSQIQQAFGTYHTPELAAGDVYTQTTGCSTWDSLPILSIPPEIEGIPNWERQNYRQ